MGQMKQYIMSWELEQIAKALKKATLVWHYTQSIV